MCVESMLDLGFWKLSVNKIICILLQSIFFINQYLFQRILYEFKSDKINGVAVSSLTA